MTDILSAVLPVACNKARINVNNFKSLCLMQLPVLQPTSEFMHQNLALLLARFKISYFADGDCVEYFLIDKSTRQEISQNLMIALNRFAGRIEIIRFYPELNKQTETKYFSAACFYLLVHHFARYFGIFNSHKVFVRTQPEIYNRFYKSLLDFNFYPAMQIANTIDLISDYMAADVDTSIIEKRTGDPTAAGFDFA